MDHARHATAHRGAAGRLHAHQLGGRVGEAGEDAGRVGAAAHAGHHHVGVGPVHQRPALLAGLVAQHAVQLADHPRVRVRAHDRAEAVVRGLHGGHPVAHGLVDGVLEGAAARQRRPHLGAQELHAEDVELLALHVDLAHVHHALEAHEGGGGGGGHAVLAGAGLGEQAGLAHALGEQGLAQHVVDLVRAGVVEVLALEQDAHAELLGQAVALGERRGRPGVVAQQAVELGAEDRVGPGVAERGVELDAGGHEGLGDEPAAEPAEAAGGVGVVHEGRAGIGDGHDEGSGGDVADGRDETGDQPRAPSRSTRANHSARACRERGRAGGAHRAPSCIQSYGANLSPVVGGPHWSSGSVGAASRAACTNRLAPCGRPSGRARPGRTRRRWPRRPPTGPPGGWRRPRCRG